MRQVIHVNQAVIAANRKNKTVKAPLIARTYKGVEHASEMALVLVDGTEVGRFVYRPHDPLACGARLWLELDTNVCQAVPS